MYNEKIGLIRFLFTKKEREKEREKVRKRAGRTDLCT